MDLGVDLKNLNMLRQLDELDRVDCEESLYTFLTHAWPHMDPAPFTGGWHIEAVAEHLQAVVDGEIKRLVINQPPRSTKTLLSSVSLPAWCWAQSQIGPVSGPGVRFMYASYNDGLSMEHSVYCRRLIKSEWYQKLWGDRFNILDDQDTKHDFANSKGGERKVTSVGARVTGRGGNCLPGWSLVSTPSGEVPISKIATGDIVFGFDHSQDKVVKERVIATRSTKAQTLYEIHTISGHSVQCTRDHPIFVEGKGYLSADRLGKGDRLVIGTSGPVQGCNTSPFAVQPMRRSDRQAPVRSAEGVKKAKRGRLLLEGLLRNSPLIQELKFLRSMWEASKTAYKGVLSGMRTEITLGSAEKETVPAMWEGVRWLESALQSGLRRCGSFGAYDWIEKLQFQSHWSLFEPVQSYAGNCVGARQLRLPALWMGAHEGQVGKGRSDESSRPPYRREQPEQHSGEPDCAMPVVPQIGASWEIDVIDRIEVFSGPEIAVYDIQVERCSNFFAGGILVHNCIIIDDPNATNDALSDVKKKEVTDWFDGTMRSRLNDPKTGAIVLIQQRVAEDDLSGHILEHNDGEWDHLMIPLLYEPERSYHTSIGWKDPRTTPGELMAPDRFDPTFVEREQKNKWVFCGQYQQRPEPIGGGIIKREWWQLWPEPAYPPMDFIIASLDTAYTVKTENDYSAMTIWGVFTQDTVAVANRTINKDGRPEYIDRAYNESGPKLMLMHAWQERLEFFDLIQKVARTCKTMKVDKLLVENKAAGISLAQEMRRLFSHENFAIQLADPKSMDKMARLFSVQHLFEEGMIYAPDKQWAEMTITQVGQFPRGKADDLVDTVSQAVRHLRDIGLLTRGPERLNEISDAFTYPGTQQMPLYPA